MDAIQVDGLRKSYGKGKIQALDGVSFAVREGEGLLGPNGAGKSTSVRILVALTKPDAGTIRASMLVNAAFSGMSHGIALLTRRESTMIAIANFIGLPLLFVSSTLVAQTQMPHWMQVASRFNPVDWGVKAAREVVLPHTDWVSVAAHCGYLLALTAAFTAFATWAFRAYQRTL